MATTEASQPTLRITDLDLEIVADIFRYVNDESPRTTSALALVNKYFHSAVKSVKYHSTSISWDDDQNVWVISRKRFVPAKPNQPSTFKLGRANVDCTDPLLLQRVRVLTVETRMNQAWKWEIVPSLDDQLIDILRKAANIKVLIWKWEIAPFTTVIEALEKYHPKAQLRISRLSIPQTPYNEPSERAELSAAALQKATCLRTLAVRAQEFVGSFDYRLIVSNAPNLEYVSIIGGYKEDAIDEDLIKPSHPKLRHLTLDGFDLSEDTVEYWSKYVDFASLVSFKCSRGILFPSYFECAADRLPGLKHVSLNLSTQQCSEDTAKLVQKYISTCSPLTKLSLWSWMGKVSLESILKQHGPTLLSLQLHEREDVMEPAGPKVMSLDDLHLIRTKCPNIKSLTFDLKRQSKKPSIEDYRPILGELVEMNLDTLEIYLDSGLSFLEIVYRANFVHEDEYDEDSEEDEDEDEDENKDENGTTHSSFAIRREIYDECAAMAVESCGGAFDSSQLASLPDPKYVLTQYFGSRRNDPDESIEFHPPSSADDICVFTGELWKYVFGARKSGARVLDLKFGEWEKKSMPRFTSMEAGDFQDMRVWTRAKPHERDDKAGQCFAEMKCCGGKHWKKWATS